ncbi:MAG: VOC family protein [Chloroflexi bacterium]|nr:VOC family protein [Chloroflexota bacterium]
MKIKRLLCDNAAVVSLEEAEKFFRDVLGAKISPEMPHGKYFGFRAKGAWLGTEAPYRLELLQSTSDELPMGRSVKRMAPRYRTVSLEVEDIDAAIAELRAKGITVTDKLDMTPKGFGGIGFESITECVIHPKDACGLRIELVEIKGKRPPPGEW